MKRQISYAAGAAEELLAFLRWAAEIDPTLGDKAVRATNRKLRQALDFPESGPVFWKDFRKLTVQPFKVLILYRILPTGIGVAAIVDARMNPRAIRGRLRSR